jgi:hypothetical protein
VRPELAPAVRRSVLDETVRQLSQPAALVGVV